jgi:DNA-binding NtrC family response regulator
MPRRMTWDTFSPAQLCPGSDRLLIADAVQDQGKACDFFRWLRDHPLPVPIFAVLPQEDGALFRAATETVDDFLVSPVRPEELKRRIARLLGPRSEELSAVQSALLAEIGLQQLVGQDPAFIKVIERVALFGANDAPVLLTGETGTGKELCARVTHLLSKRHLGPFIPVDCGALPDHLFENELFGHSKGAFTDARADQKGLVTLAQGGTLLLDEIDSLSLSAQSKVLRLLQEQTYRPLGSEVFRRADVRIIAATNRNLQELVEKKQFRSDLFFRIHVLHVHLPALRQRRSDIALLSRHFIDEICRSAHIPHKVLSNTALRKLDEHGWPGNVRELYNTLQRAVLLTPGQQIPASTIDVGMQRDDAGIDAPEDASEKFRSAKQRAIQSFEREYVRHMMHKHEGNVTQAAREAGKDRRAFGRLAKKYGFPSSSVEV